MFHVRPPSDHLSQIRLTDQKDKTSRSVWVWLNNFANFARITHQQMSLATTPLTKQNKTHKQNFLPHKYHTINCITLFRSISSLFLVLKSHTATNLCRQFLRCKLMNKNIKKKVKHRPIRNMAAAN